MTRLLRLDTRPREQRRREEVQRSIHAAERESREMLIDPGESVRAPRIGIDPDATEWFRINKYEPRHADAGKDSDAAPEFLRAWGPPFEEVVEDHRGEYVLALARDPETLAAGGIHEEIAVQLVSAPWIPHEAWREAEWKRQRSGGDPTLSPAPALSLADRLDHLTVDHLRSTYEEHRTADRRGLHAAADRAERDGRTNALAQAAELFHEIDWIRFWARRGFSFEVG